jgi:hypothetical protein
MCPAFSLSIKHILRFVFLQGTVDLRQKKKKEKEKTLTFEALVPRVVVFKKGVVLNIPILRSDLFSVCLQPWYGAKQHNQWVIIIKPHRCQDSDFGDVRELSTAKVSAGARRQSNERTKRTGHHNNQSSDKSGTLMTAHHVPRL